MLWQMDSFCAFHYVCVLLVASLLYNSKCPLFNPSIRLSILIVWLKNESLDCIFGNIEDFTYYKHPNITYLVGWSVGHVAGTIFVIKTIFSAAIEDKKPNYKKNNLLTSDHLPYNPHGPSIFLIIFLYAIFRKISNFYARSYLFYKPSDLSVCL